MFNPSPSTDPQLKATMLGFVQKARRDKAMAAEVTPEKWKATLDAIQDSIESTGIKSNSSDRQFRAVAEMHRDAELTSAVERAVSGDQPGSLLWNVKYKLKTDSGKEARPFRVVVLDVIPPNQSIFGELLRDAGKTKERQEGWHKLQAIRPGFSNTDAWVESTDFGETTMYLHAQTAEDFLNSGDRFGLNHDHRVKARAIVGHEYFHTQVTTTLMTKSHAFGRIFDEVAADRFGGHEDGYRVEADWLNAVSLVGGINIAASLDRLDSTKGAVPQLYKHLERTLGASHVLLLSMTLPSSYGPADKDLWPFDGKSTETELIGSLLNKQIQRHGGPAFQACMQTRFGHALSQGSISAERQSDKTGSSSPDFFAGFPMLEAAREAAMASPAPPALASPTAMAQPSGGRGSLFA